MEKLVISPDSVGYTTLDGEEVVSIQLDGGASRTRRDKIGASSFVNCRWSLNALQYLYLRAFYNTATAKSSIPFLVDLLIDKPDVVEHVARFVPGSWSLAETRGRGYFVEARLEVDPVAIDEEFDEALIEFYGIYEDDLPLFLNDLEQFVNFTIPSSFL